MSLNDIVKKSGTPGNFKDDRGGATVIPHPVIGIVKDNIDPTHSGRIKVYLPRFGGPDPDDATQWTTVKYLSPYFGFLAPGYDINGGGSPEDFGTFTTSVHSYGFWATAPDLGTRVVCIFINGNLEDGFYIGCIPHSGLTHMVPAIGASTKIVPNAAQAKLYGGADRLPVTEVNYSNPAIEFSSIIYNLAKPVHSYQANILAIQGLIRDNIRGVISSSSQRETPSRVFGFSTPGQTIYEGGYTNATILDAAKTADISKLQAIGRTGGHSIVMDDGKINGEDQLLRIRTSAGHMIMLSDSGQVITIMHSNGQSYIELGKEGTIDMYSTNSVNIRTEGDLNLHADRDINLNAERNLNMYAGNVNIESKQNTKLKTGGNFNSYHVGTFTVNVDAQMSLASKGNSSFLSKAITYINGDKVFLNTGASSVVPPEVQGIEKINHVNSTFSQQKGWMTPNPEPIKSIVTRTPTHMPWEEANKGVAL